MPLPIKLEATWALITFYEGELGEMDQMASALSFAKTATPTPPSKTFAASASPTAVYRSPFTASPRPRPSHGVHGWKGTHTACGTPGFRRRPALRAPRTPGLRAAGAARHRGPPRAPSRLPPPPPPSCRRGPRGRRPAGLLRSAAGGREREASPVAMVAGSSPRRADLSWRLLCPAPRKTDAGVGEP